MQAILVIGLYEVVSYGIKDDAGVIPRHEDRRTNRRLPGVCKRLGGVALIAGHVPIVKQIQQHIHAVAVTCCEELLRRRIMGRPNSVEACLLHAENAAVFGLFASGSAKETIVVVNAPAPKNRAVSVEKQTAFAPLQQADTKIELDRVQRLAVRHIGDTHGVEVGSGVGPEERFRDGEETVGAIPLHDAILLVENLDADVGTLRTAFGADTDFGGLGRCTLRHHRHIFLRNGAALRPNTDIDRAVNSRAGIPPGVRKIRVVHANFQCVLLPRPDQFRHVEGEGRITAGMGTGGRTVHSDFRAGIDPVKAEHDVLAGPIFRNVQFSSIIISTRWEPGTGSPCGGVSRAFLMDHGVMGQCDGGLFPALSPESPALVYSQ